MARQPRVQDIQITFVYMKQELQCLSEYLCKLKPWQNNTRINDQINVHETITDVRDQLDQPLRVGHGQHPILSINMDGSTVSQYGLIPYVARTSTGTVRITFTYMK